MTSHGYISLYVTGYQEAPAANLAGTWQATLLGELATETKTPKQVLLREAVDDLLSERHKGVMTLTYVRLCAALRAARQQLSAYSRDIVQRNAGVVPLQNCDQGIDRVDVARTEIDGRPKRTV